MGIEHQVVSGTGFSGLEPSESAIGTPGATGYNYKPVARWTDIPSQIFRKENIHVGVMAYHSEGIKEVEFKLNGGDGITVGEQTINPETGLPEYFVTINRTDVLNKVGEGLENFELRAIVRPNTGQVKILQHDLSTVRGEEAGALVLAPYGISGGFQTNFQNTRLHPGEHSYFGAFLKNNTESALPDLEVFMSPTGSDTNDGLSRATPVRTVERASIILRNLSAQNSDFHALDGSVHYTDVSTGVIILMAGTYHPEHYSIESVTGSGSSTDRRIYTEHNFLRIMGDPLEDRENIILEIPVEQSERDDFPVGDVNHPDYWKHLRKNGTLYLYQLSHLTIKRNNSGRDQTNFAIVYTGFPLVLSSNKPTFQGVWFKDIKFETLENLKSWRETFATFHVNYGSSETQRIMTECEHIGPTEIFSQMTWFRNNTSVKGIYDYFKQYSFSCGNDLTKNEGNSTALRRIYFDPDDPNNGDYAKFNGYYAPIRHWDHLEDKTQSINNGLNIIPLKEDGNKLDPLGVIWQKIKIDMFNGAETGFYKNLEDPVDDECFTYGELATKYGLIDGYFPDPDNRNLPVNPQSYSPVFYRKHGIHPHLHEEKHFDVPNSYDLIGERVYDDYFEPYYMSLVQLTDETIHGMTGYGFALFDSRKPLVYGDDKNPNTQDFLWRYSGDVLSTGNHFRNGSTGNFYIKQNNDVVFPYSFAKGFTTSQPPRGGNDLPSDDEVGSTNDAYPVLCYASSGSDDPLHTDLYQYFMTDSQAKDHDGINRIENTLAAYNYTRDMDSQFWNIELGNNKTEPYQDIAFVNNVFGGIHYNRGYNSSAFSAIPKNLLVLNNTFANASTTFRSGMNIYDGITGELHIPNTHTTWNPYLESIYGSNGVTLDRFTEHVVFKNNYMDGVVGDLFKADAGHIETSSSSPFKGTTGSVKSSVISTNNYFWPFGTETIGSYQQQQNILQTYEYADELPRLEGPKFKNHPLDSGGNQYDPTVEWDYTPHISSGLIGGGSGSVPFDIKRRKRIERSTAGAIEPDEINTISNNESYSASSLFSTTTSLDLSSLTPESLYGKTIKVVGITGGENVFSTNALRLENKWLDFDLIDRSVNTDFEFRRFTGGDFQRSQYNAAVEFVDGELILNTVDWMTVDYSIDELYLHEENHNGLHGNRLRIRFTGDNPSAAASAFSAAYQASSSDIGFDLEVDTVPTTHFLDKSTELVSSSTIYYYLHRGTEGITFNVTLSMLPSGNVVINKPIDM